eukprot:g13846.t1
MHMHMDVQAQVPVELLLIGLAEAVAEPDPANLMQQLFGSHNHQAAGTAPESDVSFYEGNLYSLPTFYGAEAGAGALLTTGVQHEDEDPNQSMLAADQYLRLLAASYNEQTGVVESGSWGPPNAGLTNELTPLQQLQAYGLVHHPEQGGPAMEEENAASHLPAATALRHWGQQQMTMQQLHQHPSDANQIQHVLVDERTGQHVFLHNCWPTGSSTRTKDAVDESMTLAAAPVVGASSCSTSSVLESAALDRLSGDGEAVMGRAGKSSSKEPPPPPQLEDDTDDEFANYNEDCCVASSDDEIECEIENPEGQGENEKENVRPPEIWRTTVDEKLARGGSTAAKAVEAEKYKKSAFARESTSNQLQQKFVVPSAVEAGGDHPQTSSAGPGGRQKGSGSFSTTTRKGQGTNKGAAADVHQVHRRDYTTQSNCNSRTSDYAVQGSSSYGPPLAGPGHMMAFKKGKCGIGKKEAGQKGRRADTKQGWDLFWGGGATSSKGQRYSGCDYNSVDCRGKSDYKMLGSSTTSTSHFYNRRPYSEGESSTRQDHFNDHFQRYDRGKGIMGSTSSSSGDNFPAGGAVPLPPTAQAYCTSAGPPTSRATRSPTRENNMNAALQLALKKGEQYVKTQVAAVVAPGGGEKENAAPVTPERTSAAPLGKCAASPPADGVEAAGIGVSAAISPPARGTGGSSRKGSTTSPQTVAARMGGKGSAAPAAASAGVQGSTMGKDGRTGKKGAAGLQPAVGAYPTAGAKAGPQQQILAGKKGGPQQGISSSATSSVGGGDSAGAKSSNPTHPTGSPHVLQGKKGPMHHGKGGAMLNQHHLPGSMMSGSSYPHQQQQQGTAFAYPAPPPRVPTSEENKLLAFLQACNANAAAGPLAGVGAAASLQEHQGSTPQQTASTAQVLDKLTSMGPFTNFDKAAIIEKETGQQMIFAIDAVGSGQRRILQLRKNASDTRNGTKLCKDEGHGQLLLGAAAGADAADAVVEKAVVSPASATSTRVGGDRKKKKKKKKKSAAAGAHDVVNRFVHPKNSATLVGGNEGKEGNSPAPSTPKDDSLAARLSSLGVEDEPSGTPRKADGDNQVDRKLATHHDGSSRGNSAVGPSAVVRASVDLGQIQSDDHNISVATPGRTSTPPRNISSTSVSPKCDQGYETPPSQTVSDPGSEVLDRSEFFEVEDFLDDDAAGGSFPHAEVGAEVAPLAHLQAEEVPEQGRSPRLEEGVLEPVASRGLAAPGEGDQHTDEGGSGGRSASQDIISSGHQRNRTPSLASSGRSKSPTSVASLSLWDAIECGDLLQDPNLDPAVAHLQNTLNSTSHSSCGASCSWDQRSYLNSYDNYHEDYQHCYHRWNNIDHPDANRGSGISNGRVPDLWYNGKVARKVVQQRNCDLSWAAQRKLYLSLAQHRHKVERTSMKEACFYQPLNTTSSHINSATSTTATTTAHHGRSRTASAGGCAVGAAEQANPNRESLQVQQQKERRWGAAVKSCLSFGPCCSDTTMLALLEWAAPLTQAGEILKWSGADTGSLLLPTAGSTSCSEKNPGTSAAAPAPTPCEREDLFPEWPEAPLKSINADLRVHIEVRNQQHLRNDRELMEKAVDKMYDCYYGVGWAAGAGGAAAEAEDAAPAEADHSNDHGGPKPNEGALRPGREERSRGAAESEDPENAGLKIDFERGRQAFANYCRAELGMHSFRCVQVLIRCGLCAKKRDPVVEDVMRAQREVDKAAAEKGVRAEERCEELFQDALVRAEMEVKLKRNPNKKYKYFLTQAELVEVQHLAFGKVILPTPDFLFLDPIQVPVPRGGHGSGSSSGVGDETLRRVTWFDSKAECVTPGIALPQMLHKLHNQFYNYVNCFGPGVVVWANGFTPNWTWDSSAEKGILHARLLDQAA